MKKFLVAVSLLCLLVSCDRREQPHSTTVGVENADCCIMEFTVRDKTHEYIYFNRDIYRAGMTHLPECKYCSQTDSI